MSQGLSGVAGSNPAKRNGMDLAWLPDADGDWSKRVKAVQAAADLSEAWAALVQLANYNLDFLKTDHLGAVLRKRFSDAPPPGLATRPVRLAVLGTSTLSHLISGMRVGALRRNVWIDVYEGDYGQYVSELRDPNSALHAFKPDMVLLSLDSVHLLRGFSAVTTPAEATSEVEAVLAHVQDCWRLVREQFGCPVIQQTLLPVFSPVMGGDENRLPSSKVRGVTRVNEAIRQAAESDNIDILSIDDWVSRFGLASWHNPTLWHRAKQQVSPVASPFYGDLVGRLIGARQGLSAKCLVLDLDNTLWGGVIGDDGLEGIVLGQGSAAGEAFLVLQNYALELARRGILLAVCSKNDEVNAFAAFDQHPDMLLKRSDITCFVANWDDKAKNIRQIAKRLNIGLDSLVFVDDNPFERNLVRTELPMVRVPELHDEPGLMARTVADAGYFEGVGLTDEDRERTQQYRANAERVSLQADASDMESYLRSLDMKLIWRPFDRIGLPRIVQLINKTNQFNLTTRRYTEREVAAVIDDPRQFGLQLRLVDRFGDNGIIGIVIGVIGADGRCRLDTWLMSCRVLGRQVEEATLNIVDAEACRLSATTLVGEYLPTAKNAMVAELYPRLGFAPEAAANSGQVWMLDLALFAPKPVIMIIEQARDAVAALA
jgi:FkbH-like protein